MFHYSGVPCGLFFFCLGKQSGRDLVFLVKARALQGLRRFWVMRQDLQREVGGF